MRKRSALVTLQKNGKDMACREDYLSQTAKQSFYATPTEIQAACELFNVQIRVIRTDLETIFGSAHHHCIMLRHSGPFDDGHFHLLVPPQDNSNLNRGQNSLKQRKVEPTQETQAKDVKLGNLIRSRKCTL